MDRDFYQFVRALIHFRHSHPALRVNEFDGQASTLFPSCSFHGCEPWQPDWSDQSRQLAWMMSTNVEPAERSTDTVYVGTNMAHYATWYRLPMLPDGYSWHLCFNTGDRSNPYQSSASLVHEDGILIGDRSVVILTALPS